MAISGSRLLPMSSALKSVQPSRPAAEAVLNGTVTCGPACSAMKLPPPSAAVGASTWIALNTLPTGTVKLK